MTSLRELDGRYHIAFDYGGMAFCEDLRLPVCPQNSGMATALHGKIAAAIADGSFQLTNFFPGHPLAAFLDSQAVGAGNPAFGPFALQWFRERRIEWRPSYIETMGVNLRRYLLPRFGSMAIAAIDKTAIMEFRLYLAEQAGLYDDTTLSPARINKIMQALRMILDDATERMDLRSPWRNIRSLREKTPDLDPLSLQEIDCFLRHVRSDFRSYFELRFLTGLRSSEVNALVGKNVLLSEAKLDVRHALMKKRFVDLKTRA